MSEEQIQQDRSPRSPTIPLEEAIETTRKLYQAARNASIKPDVAVKVLGYSGPNGAAMTTLATLAKYGLVDRTGGNVAVTPLAVKIFHPISGEQKMQAILDASLAPAVFRELLKGYEECSLDIITGQLIQNRFTPDRAKKVAHVFLANRVYTGASSTNEVKDVGNEDVLNGETEGKTLPGIPVMASNSSGHTASLGNSVITAAPIIPGQKILAQYSIPLGENEATLVFTGQALTVEDFDALGEFVAIFKKQYERKLAAQKAQVEKSEGV